MVMEQIANLSTGNRCQGSNPCLSAIYRLITIVFSGCSVARLSRLVWDEEVAGSNPATPTNIKRAFTIVKALFVFMLPQYIAAPVGIKKIPSQTNNTIIFKNYRNTFFL